MVFFTSAFSSNDAMSMHFHGPFSCHTPGGEEDGTQVVLRGMLALHDVVWHVLPVAAHHLLFAFPAIKLETAGKSPLVQVQGFPPCCCTLHTSVVSQAELLFPSPPAGELGGDAWTSMGQCCSVWSYNFWFVGLFRGTCALKLLLLKG